MIPFHNGLISSEIALNGRLPVATRHRPLGLLFRSFDRSDVDVSIFFLAANRLSYDSPVDDPFFPAHNQAVNLIDGVTISEYWADQHITSLACADQPQFCNLILADLDSQPDGCIPLTGTLRTLSALLNIGLNDRQKDTADLLTDSIYDMYNPVIGRQASALLASQTVYDNEQQSLPNNQWQIEVANWLATFLARLQQGVIEYALYRANTPVMNNTLLELERVVYKSQKIHNPLGYQNYSIFSIAIILIGGFLVILIGTIIDTCVGCAKRLLNRGYYSRIVWDLDQTLSLQSMAQEGAGLGPFTKCNDTIPRTAKANQVGPYDVTDEHPRIARRGGGGGGGGARISKVAIPSGGGQSEKNGLVYHPFSDFPVYPEDG